MVFFYHIAWQFLFADQGAQNTFFSIFSQGGWTGVGFFFVLSGFVLTWARRPSDTVPTFWRRRIVKIYPNHIITAIAAAILILTATDMVIDKGYAAANILLIQSWFPQSGIRFSLNPVAWSLSVEALFYFSFPFLMLLIDKIRPERLWYWAGGVVAAILSIPLFATLLPEQQPFPVVGLTDWELWFVYQFPPVRLLDFVFGILLARIVLAKRKLPFNLGGAVAFAIAMYALAPLCPPMYTVVGATVLPLGLVIAAAAAGDVAKQPSWLASRPMVWLGEISFAFYLWQNMVLVYGHKWLGTGKTFSTPATFGLIVVFLAVMILLSWALYTFVERPLVKRFSNPRRRGSGPGAPAVPAQRGASESVPAGDAS